MNRLRSFFASVYRHLPDFGKPQQPAVFARSFPLTRQGAVEPRVTAPSGARLPLEGGSTCVKLFKANVRKNFLRTRSNLLMQIALPLNQN